MDLKLCIDYPIENQCFPGEIYLAGWVISKAGSADISIYINNKRLTNHVMRIERSDVLHRYPEYKSKNPLPGFIIIISKPKISSGIYTLKVTAMEDEDQLSVYKKIQIENMKYRGNILSDFSWKIIKKILSTVKISNSKLQESNNDSTIRITRKQMITSKIKPGLQEGLEIGPLCNPTMTKTECNGCVWYVDHVSTEELREKYQNDSSVFLENLVHVDFVWGKNSLPELVNNHQYDYVIASHVIEHVPDMIGWINEISEVLKDNGILSLAIPDKRYSFDLLREISTPGMIIEAYLRHKRRPGPSEIFDHVALARTVDVVSAWNGTIDKSNLEQSHNFQIAFDIARDSFTSEHYHDVHVNVFTPESFLNLLEMFIKLDLIDFQVVDFYNTFPYTLEFFIMLERIPRNSDRSEYRLIQLESISRARQRIKR